MHITSFHEQVDGPPFKQAESQPQTESITDHKETDKNEQPSMQVSFGKDDELASVVQDINQP